MLRDRRCCGAIRKRLFRQWLSMWGYTVKRTVFLRPKQCRLNLEWVRPVKFGVSSLVIDDRSYLREVDGDNDGLSDVISVTETSYHHVGLRTDIELSTNYMFKLV